MVLDALSAWMTSTVAWIEGLPPATSATVLFALTVVLTVSAFMTTTPLNFAAGAIFGILPGAIIFNAGCAIGSLINFLLGRFFLRSWARRKLEESPTLKALEVAVRKRSREMVILARLSPAFPFAIVGYVLGATSIDAFEFTWATAAGLFPGCLLYAWIGSSMRELGEGGGDGSSLQSWVSIGIGVASTVLVSVQAKKAFDEALKNRDSQ